MKKPIQLLIIEDNEGDAILVGDCAGSPQVGHGDGLAADGIIGYCGINQRDILRSCFLNQGFQFLGVHVALERVLLILAALGDFPQQGLVEQVAGGGTHLLDIAFGGIKVAVGGDGEILAGMPLVQNLGDDGKEYRLGGPALGHDKSVRPLHLGGAAVKKPALVLAQVHLIHHFVNVLAVGAHQVNDALLVVPALKAVPQGVQQDIVTLVAAVGFVAQHQGGPLHVSHGGGAGIGQHVNGEHARGKGKFVVVGGLQGAFALLQGDVGDIPLDISEGTGCRDIQGIFGAHKYYLHFWHIMPTFKRIPRSSRGRRAWGPAPATGGQYLV